jgi:hypothetical protein
MDDSVLIALQIISFVVLFIYSLDRHHSDAESGTDWRGSFLIASLLWGVLVVVITEGLSLLNAITRPWVTGAWLVALFIIIWLGLRRGIFQKLVTRFRLQRLPFTSLEWSAIIGMGLILVILAVIAWIAPPNTSDSLLYHMARIAHWVQQSNLGHFPTAYLTQLWASPFAEMSILNLQILWGSDQPANMIQLFSLIGAVLGVSAISKLLGANRKGQFLSAAFTISIPMGILQATSTQTDFVTAFWLICLVYFVILSKRKSVTALERNCIGLSTGLGMLTKGTFYPLALPILLWYFLPSLNAWGIRRSLREGISFAAIILLINIGFWGRNIASFDGPLGPRDAIDSHTELSFHPGNWLSNILHHVAQNYASPWEDFNDGIASSINAIDTLIGVEEGEFKLVWAWNQEDFAGNPLHISSLILLILVYVLFRRKINSSGLKEYLWIFFASFLLFAIVIHSSRFSTRLQLPILVLGAPAFGVILSRLELERLNSVLLIGLLSISFPWVLFNSSRPIIAMRQGPEPWAIPCTFGCTRTGSIFFRSREDLIFANWPELQEPITNIAENVVSSGCQRVGLRLDSHDMEYLFWWSLGAPSKFLRVESISTFPELETFLDPSFNPCALICTTCGYRTEAFGLELSYNRQLLSLFLGDGFTEEIDP